MYQLGTSSKKNLEGLHPILIRIVNRAIEITKVDFSVVEGVRTKERQKELIESGASWTMNSYHIPREVEGLEEEVGMAVDIYPWVNGKTDHDEEHYKKIAKAMFRASQEEGVRLEWGGLWNEKQNDQPHWQLLV